MAGDELTPGWLANDHSRILQQLTVINGVVELVTKKLNTVLLKVQYLDSIGIKHDLEVLGHEVHELARRVDDISTGLAQGFVALQSMDESLLRSQKDLSDKLDKVLSLLGPRDSTAVGFVVGISAID